MSSIEVLPSYGYVIAVAAATSFHCTVQGFAVAGFRYSSEGFTSEYLLKNYPEENEIHKKEFGTPLPVGGHPDNGLGRLSDKLPFVTWAKLQNAQRAHLNYCEALPGVLCNLLLAGLFYPVTAAAFGLTHMVGRQIYASAYRKSGANARGPGFGIAFLSNIALMGMSISGGLKLAGVFGSK
eukprot:CAMPEP_0172493588 /NCGR_PEP_ID=MMETSP1066-20121228/25013_1 /TAXON_ID=671091 /ORGANISM="Coscinodiscus wailesii, Strain CCMP2513" /LENGTH=180 /DNA_ID=CAMNT_0013263809 /DNA_START=64 /DNA_END=606 /DNA_ORIENTATION=+